ncbi:type II toxin-antitoxin system HipA family toxin [Salinarimonas rosea]|uniref:type II toxin-antitoxin system HipA family toxin n=1 Tax=Salinarimonas rosea TaxID=552063 RepID=UPI00041ECB97|nr:type II toxin-antitoxin system HipA family toxin [Salinarimonas rosea]
MNERLAVHLDFGGGTPPRRMGRLGRDPARRAIAFEWDEAFAAAPLPVSPLRAGRYRELLRPDAGRGATLPGLFEDSLPDGWGRLLLDREMAERGVDPAELGDLARLAYVGRHGMGALTYQPELATAPDDAVDLAWFEDVIPRVEDAAAVDELARLRTLAGGSQGARPKLVALIDEGNTRQRDHRGAPGGGWRAVLVKGRGSSDPKGSVEGEIAYGAAMRAAGIRTTPMLPLAGARECFLATDRFDRVGDRRLHTATVAGLLDTGMVHGSIDYLAIVKLARVVTRSAEDVEEVFRRAVFNARAFNRDDHVRNHAFLMDAAGTWRLAPAYDVTFSAGPGGEHSTAIAGEGRRPGRAAFARLAQAAGLKPRRRDAVVDAVDAALAQWPRLADEHDVPRALASRVASAIDAARRWE